MQSIQVQGGGGVSSLVLVVPTELDPCLVAPGNCAVASAAVSSLSGGQEKSLSMSCPFSHRHRGTKDIVGGFKWSLPHKHNLLRLSFLFAVGWPAVPIGYRRL